MSHETSTADLLVCPECAAGKHPNCDGTTMDLDTDRLLPCECAFAQHAVARDVSGSARARGAVDGGAAVTDPQTSETPRCSCGSPDTFSLNRSEVVVHATDACRIWPDGGTTDGRDPQALAEETLRLAEWATDGPWEVTNWVDHLGERTVLAGGHRCYEVERLSIMRPEDADFIAHARTAAPALARWGLDEHAARVAAEASATVRATRGGNVSAEPPAREAGPAVAETQPTSETPTHFVTLDLERNFLGDRMTLICKAPAEAECHAVWDCDCETWCWGGVEDGKPWHDPRDYSETDRGERHVGRFDPDECNLADWAENSDECLRGTITIPLRAEFDGDYYLFHAASGTVEASR